MIVPNSDTYKGRLFQSHSARWEWGFKGETKPDKLVLLSVFLTFSLVIRDPL